MAASKRFAKLLLLNQSKNYVFVSAGLLKSNEVKKENKNNHMAALPAIGRGVLPAIYHSNAR